MFEQPSSQSLRRRLRVSVRALMILVLLAGGGLGWFVRKGRFQRESVAAIEKAGGIVFYDCEINPDAIPRPRYLEWLDRWVGIDYFSDVVEISLPGDLSDAELVLIGRFPRLETLWYVGSRSSVTDAGLAQLDGLTRLKQLDLSDTDITDAGLVHLRGMASLQELDLSDTQITDAGLVHLRGLTSLQMLRLRNTKVGEAGVVHLKTLTNLQLLDCSGTDVDDLVAQELRRALPSANVGFRHIWAQ